MSGWLFPSALAVLLLIGQRLHRRANQREAESIMTTLDTLRAKIAASTTVTESAITLLQGLKERLDAAILADNSDEALQELSDSLDAETVKLAQAVSENTPTVTAAGVDHSTATANTSTPAFADLPDSHPLKGGDTLPRVPDVTGPVTDQTVIKAPGSQIATPPGSVPQPDSNNS